MELIKEIKQAETQAHEIIEQAKVQAAEAIEENRLKQAEKLVEAEQQRKKAVETAVAAAESEGLEEIKQLKADAENQKQHLKNQTHGKVDAAAAKVKDYLRD